MMLINKHIIYTQFILLHYITLLLAETSQLLQKKVLHLSEREVSEKFEVFHC